MANDSVGTQARSAPHHGSDPAYVLQQMKTVRGRRERSMGKPRADRNPYFIPVSHRAVQSRMQGQGAETQRCGKLFRQPIVFPQDSSAERARASRMDSFSEKRIMR
jgi:hypothetical protein